MKGFAELAIQEYQGCLTRIYTTKTTMMMMTAMEKENDEYLKLVSVYLSFKRKLRFSVLAATKVCSHSLRYAVRDFPCFLYIK